MYTYEVHNPLKEKKLLWRFSLDMKLADLQPFCKK